jgi:hypothetical protein
MRITAVDNFNAVVDHKINILLDELPGDTELRNDVTHHATGAGFTLK